jgi:hypothetical protein
VARFAKQFKVTVKAIKHLRPLYSRLFVQNGLPDVGSFLQKEVYRMHHVIFWITLLLSYGYIQFHSLIVYLYNTRVLMNIQLEIYFHSTLV